MSKRKSGRGREFDEPARYRGSKLVTLCDAASYITALPEKESTLPGMAGRDRGANAVGGLGGPTMFARRCHESIEPGPRSGV
jgi:hypothetical protein